MQMTCASSWKESVTDRRAASATQAGSLVQRSDQGAGSAVGTGGQSSSLALSRTLFLARKPYRVRQQIAGVCHWRRSRALTHNLAAGYVGIGTTSPSAMLSVGSSSQFQVNSTGDLAKVNSVFYNWPSSQGAANQVLTNNGSGTLTWTTVSGGSSGTGSFSLDIVGTGDGTGTAAGGTLRGPNITGTNLPGANLTIAAGDGTGTGGSGAINFQTAPVATTGSTANTLATAMTITATGNVGIGTINPTAKLALGGTAGTDGIKFPDLTLQTTASTTNVQGNANGLVTVTSSWADSGVGITLPSAGTYLITAEIDSTLSCSAGSPALIQAKLRDITNSVDLPNTIRTANYHIYIGETKTASKGYAKIYTVAGSATVRVWSTRATCTTWTTSSLDNIDMTFVKLNN